MIKLVIELLIGLCILAAFVWLVNQIFPDKDIKHKDSDLDDIYHEAEEVSSKKKDLSEKVSMKEKTIGDIKNKLNN